MSFTKGSDVPSQVMIRVKPPCGGGSGVFVYSLALVLSGPRLRGADEVHDDWTSSSKTSSKSHQKPHVFEGPAQQTHQKPYVFGPRFRKQERQYVFGMF